MKTDNQTAEITQSRRPWLKRIGCGLLILLVSAIGAWEWRHRSAQQHLTELFAELDRTEPGWRLEDLEAARVQVPEEQNSARVVVMAAQNLPRSWPQEELSEDYFWLLPPNEMLNGEDYVRLLSESANARTASDIASKLADMPRGRHRPLYTPDAIFPKLPRDQLNSRRIVTLLVYESLKWNQRGESKTALTACRAALNAARSIGDEPSPSSQLIRCAGIDHVCRAVERTLGQGEPPLEDVRALRKLLEDEDAFPDQLVAVRGQRAAENRVFEGVEHGEASVQDLTAKQMGWLERKLPSLWYMDAREDHALFLSLMAQRIQEVQRPMSEQTALEKQFEQAVHALPERAVLTRTMLPAVSRSGERFRRKHAYLRCAIIVLAAECYRRGNQAWPDNIDQLYPQYLASVPLDPLDGYPLGYRRLKDAVVIKANGQDAFRLWEVAQRRQPPQPKLRNEEKPR